MCTSGRKLCPLKTEFPLKHYLRLVICSLISLTLTAFLLWGLVSYSDPTATLNLFQLTVNGSSIKSVAIETRITNNNLFRGFNYTDGWIEIFYVPDNNISKFSVDEAYRMELTYEYIQVLPQYQGPRSIKKWSFDWGSAVSNSHINFTNLQGNKSHFYVSLYMGYWYKILSWTTNTVYYQWLDAHVYVNYNKDVGTYTAQIIPLPFNRIKDFNWAISS